jgi:hypothetical protein
MKRFCITLFAFVLSGIALTYATDDLHDRAQHRINIAHLPLTDVKICLWNNATGTLNIDAAGCYMLSTICPTTQGEQRLLSMSRKIAEAHALPQFHALRKMPLKYDGEWLDCQEYNELHGEQRAQKVVAALTELYQKKNADEVTEEDLNAIYVSDWQPVKGKMYEKVQQLLAKGKSSEVPNILHSPAMIESSKIMHTVSMIEDADALASMIAKNGFTNHTAIEFAEHISLKHTVGFKDKKAKAPVAPSQTEPKFSKGTDNMFKGMFGPRKN